MSVRGDIEDGIYAVLTDDVAYADVDNPTPLVTVSRGGAALSDSQIAEELEKLANANTAPAALIVYSGGGTDEGVAGIVDAPEVFTILVVVAGRSRQAAVLGDNAATGLYDVLEWIEDKLHNRIGIEGIDNPLRFMGNRRFQIPGYLMSCAAYAVDFRAPLYLPD